MPLSNQNTQQGPYIFKINQARLPDQTPDNHPAVQMDGLMEQHPDRVARVQQWAQKTGYAPEVIGKDLERFEKLQSLPERAELDDLRANAPATYNLITNPADAPLVADEYRAMGMFEKWFKQAGRSARVEWLQGQKARALLKQREEDERGGAYGNSFADEIELLDRQITAIGQPTGSAWSNWAWHTAQFGTQMALAQPEALGGAAAGAATLGAAGAAAGTVVPGAGNLGLGTTGAIWGARGGYIAGLAKYAYDMESAFAYEGLRNLKDKNGQPIPVASAIKASRTVGYINAALETAGDLVFAGGVLKPAGKLAGKAAAKTLSKVTSGKLAKIPGSDMLLKIIGDNPARFENMTLRRALIEAAKIQLLEATTETSTEYAQNVVQLAAEERAKQTSGQPFERRTLGQIAAESTQGMGGVFVGSLVLGTAGAGTHLTNALWEMHEAERVGALLKDLHDKGVKDLKLTERAPDKAIAFLAQKTNGTSFENLYIPIKAIDRVAEENELDPHEFLQSISPETAAQYDEAKATNGNIEVNTALFGVKSQQVSAKTGKSIFDALVDDMKTDPESRTANEMREEVEAMAKQADQAEELIASGTARQEELDRAYQDMRLQLDATVAPEGMNETEWENQKEGIAQLNARLAVTEAHKRGQDYFEMIEQRPLPIVQVQFSPAQQQAYEQAQEVYGKIKDAIVRNEEIKEAQENGGATPIIDYLIKRGGVLTENTDWAGETENWRLKESNIRGLINNKDGLKLYEAANAVQSMLEQNGWGSLIDLSDPGATTVDVPDLIDAVNNEIVNYVPFTKRERVSKRMDEILNVSTGQFKTLYEKEFGEKLPDRGTNALKNLHLFLLREAVKDGMRPSESVLAEHRINAEALAAGNFDFGQEIGRGLLQGINYPINADVLTQLDTPLTPVKIVLPENLPAWKTHRKSFGQNLLKAWNKLYGKSTRTQARTLTNKATGWTASLPNSAADEIFTSSTREGRAFGPRVAYALASHIGELFENAVLVKSHPDDKNRRQGVKQIHRFFVPAEIDGEMYSVKLTVREFGNRKVLSVETFEQNGERDFAIYTLAPAKKVVSSGTYGNTSDLAESVSRPALDTSDIVTSPAAPVNPTLRDLLRGVTDTSGAYNRDAAGRELFQFAGQAAQTADPLALEKAQRLLEQGKDPETVRKQTGWFKGPDGKMRFEISDKDAEILPQALEHFGNRVAAQDEARLAFDRLHTYQEEQKHQPGKYKPGVIEELIELADKDLSKANKKSFAYAAPLRLKDVLKHDALFKAYPYLENVSVEVDTNHLDDSMGSYYAQGNSIWLNGDLFEQVKQKYNKNFNREKSIQEAKSVLMHEVQHAIQQLEGFARGGNTDEFIDYTRKRQLEQERAELEKRQEAGEDVSDAIADIDFELAEYNDFSTYDKYKHLAGEVEARNTQARMDMTDEERLQAAPESTQDVKNADAIVKFTGGQEFAYNPDNYTPELVVTHSTTLYKLREALELGGMPMPSLAVTKKDLAADDQYGEITFISGPDILQKQNTKTFTADIYSTRRVSPEMTINKAGDEYIEKIVSGKTKSSAYHWSDKAEQTLSYGDDTLKALYLAEKGEIKDLDHYPYQQIMNVPEAEFEPWKRKFMANYVDKRIFKGFTPSGNRRYAPYDLVNVVAEMRTEKLKGSEGGFGGSPNALKGVWAKELKDIQQMRREKGRLVSAEDYQKANQEFSENFDKLTDLLMTEKAKQTADNSYLPYNAYVVSVLRDLPADSKKWPRKLEEWQLNANPQAVSEIKAFKEFAQRVPTKYFESKPQRPVYFHEFDGVLLPADKQYDEVANELQAQGVGQVVRYKTPEERKEAIEEFGHVFFQPAYAGARVDFDAFSLSAIGTGEGAQAHGWGLYFAGNKQVAEKYREKLARFLPKPDDILIYDGKEYLPGDKSIMREALDYLNDKEGNKEKTVHKLKQLKDDSEFYANVDWADKQQKEGNKKDAEHYAELLRIVEGLDPEKFTFKKGQLFEVEIPENNVLLDEQKPFSQQPEKVQKALEKIANDYDIDLSDKVTLYGKEYNSTGWYIYNQLADKHAGLSQQENMRWASETLSKYGIKGITYDGRRDGRCFVIFDDQAIDILDKYYQRASGRARGAFNDIKNIITLTPDANYSTLTHELAHYWLNERWQYMLSGLADEKYKKDFAPLANYLGIKEGQTKITRAQHEKFATSFEVYLHEGKAPSMDLRRLFSRLRSWMVYAYRSIKKELGIELNNDIRRVFDRMLATEEEIAAIERERSYEPFTKLPGMTEADVARLKQMREDARAQAVTQIMKRDFEELEFENNIKRIYAEEKETEQVETELSADPSYQLANIVESHFATSDYFKAHGKFTDTLQDGTAHEFTRLPGFKEIAHAFHDNRLSENDRALFTVLAENNGFTAPELAEMLVSLKDFATARDEEVARRMEKYKLNKDMKSLRRAIAEAVTNEEALAVLALERDLFMNNKRTASMQRSLETKALAKQSAKNWLHAKPAQKAAWFSPYFTAQKRAALKAARALRNKDYEAAALAKEEELFNAAAASESVKINKRLHRMQEYFKYMQRKKLNLLKKQEHFLQVADLLRRLGFPRTDYDVSMKVETLAEWAQRMKKRGLDGVAIPEWLMDGNVVLDYRRLNIDQLQDVTDTLKNINHTANFEDRLFTMHKRANLDDVAIQISQHLRNTVSNETRAKNEDQIEPEKKTAKDYIQDYLFSLVKFDTLVHKADGYKDFGLMYDIFLRPMKEAADQESVHARKLFTALKELFEKHYTPQERKDLFEVKKYYPELGNEATKERLLVIALNMGNDLNKQRLFDNGVVGAKFKKDVFGVGKDNSWSEEMVNKLMRENLTANDWDFVQGVWDLINEPWGAISQMHERLTGFVPGKVEAVPFAIATADGKVANLRGGYYPLKYDWRTDSRAEQQKLEEEALYEGSPATLATTKQGHTKRRAAKVGSQISLNINLIERHLTEVLHDLYFRPLVVDMRRLLAHPVVQESIKRNLGRSAFAMFRNQLNNVADGSQYRGGVGILDKSIEFLRRNTTISVLAAKPSIIVENLANPWLFINAIDGFTSKDVLAAVAFAMSEYGPQSLLKTDKAKALQAFVFSKSPLMKDKSENFDVTMRQLKKTNLFGKDSRALEIANGLVVATDDFFAIPMWFTCYKKFTDQFIKEGKSSEEAENLAVARADMLINRVLGSGRRYDAAEFVRNKTAIARALNMFATFMNNEFNRWYRETGLLAKEHDYERFAYFIGNRLMWVTCSMMLAGKWPDDLAPDELLKWWFSGIVDNASGMFLVLRDFTPALMDKLMGWPSFGYRPTPLSGTVEDIILRPVEAARGFTKGKKKGQDALESGAKAASLVMPYPQQFNTWFFNVADYFNGSTPRLRDFYRRRPKKQRGN